MKKKIKKSNIKFYIKEGGLKKDPYFTILRQIKSIWYNYFYNITGELN
jgi:hypothetical protein